VTGRATATRFTRRRPAFALTIVAVAAAAVTLVAWSLAGKDASFVVERVVAVLVIACPHALGLAIPLVVAISTTLGARNGLLVRNRRGLEDAQNVNAVFFDKTGTLTRGEFRVVEITTEDGLTADQALALAAAVERESEHTIAQEIVKTAEERRLSIARVVVSGSSRTRGAGDGFRQAAAARRTGAAPRNRRAGRFRPRARD
jgi:P-type Cu2+ transporter